MQGIFHPNSQLKPTKALNNSFSKVELSKYLTTDLST